MTESQSRRNGYAISGAEFKCMREFLGLDLGWMARDMLADKRRLLRMEKDEEDVPERYEDHLDAIYDETKRIVDTLIEKYRDLIATRKSGEAEFIVYRSDDDYWRDSKRTVDNGGRFHAEWHRRIAQRVSDAVPGVRPVYRNVPPRKPKPWELDGKKPSASGAR
jgi:hypothetical protein